jgi:hypothetical protein
MQRVGLEVTPKRNAIVLIIIMAVSAALAGIFVLFTSQGGSSGPNAIFGSLNSFSSYSKLQSFIAENARSAQQYNDCGGGG